MAKSFKKRTTAPSASDKWWQTKYNPCVGVSNGTVLPNCVGYAWGRFAEILGSTSECKLPTCDAGNWIDNLNTSKYKHGKTPKLGAVAVWKKPGHPGHVAVVEEIRSDGSVVFSESGWGQPWGKRWWLSNPLSGPNYYHEPYKLQGFIYQPVDYGNGGDDPREVFIKEAAAHIGDKGHAWVQSKTSIGSGPWCAATMCAIAIATGFAGKNMPKAEYGAGNFGYKIVKDYGGTYIKGGENVTPDIGDFIELFPGSGPSVNLPAKYQSHHVGVVEKVNKDGTIGTIEGNHSNAYCRVSRRKKDIGWYARPDWSKVGGAVSNSVEFEPLYTTSSTRADASIREVGYITSDGKPSISSTGIRLSAINYTSVLAGIVSMMGGTTTGSEDGSEDDISKLPPKVRETVEYLKNHGLNTAAAVGVCANIRAESNFNTAAAGDMIGGKPTSFGICQWHNKRGDAMKAMAGSSWSTNLKGQLDYLWYELQHDYKSVLNNLKSVKNTESGCKEAADIFVRQFEKPASVDTQSKIRQSYAVEYWKKVVVGDGGNGSAQAKGKVTTQSGKTLTQGKAVSVPASVSQTGIIPNYTSYTGFYGRWASGTNQQKLASLWGSKGKKHKYSIATIDGYYLIALAPVFGRCGDVVSVVLDDGTFFNAIIGDEKGSDKTSKWGHVLGGSVDIVEWEAYGNSQSNLRNGLQLAGWLNKKVAKVINYGSWLR